MTKIAIIGAMEQEVTHLREQISNQTTYTHAGFEYYCGQIDQLEVILLKSGIGKVNAAVSTSLLLERYQPDYVINTGSAGGFHPELEVGDVVIGTQVTHHDVDVTPFGYVLGQVPGGPETYQADSKLIEVAKQSVNALQEVALMEGLIATGDRFMYQEDDVAQTREKFPHMLACEMEAAAIAQTCHLFNTPFVIIRSLSDIAGKENAITFEQYLDKAAIHSAKLILEMLKQF